MTHPTPRTFVFTFAALLALLVVTVGVAYVPLGALGPVAALAVAITKAVLVALFFMELRYRSGVVWLFAAAGFVWLGLLFALTLADYLTR